MSLYVLLLVGFQGQIRDLPCSRVKVFLRVKTDLRLVSWFLMACFFFFFKLVDLFIQQINMELLMYVFLMLGMQR